MHPSAIWTRLPHDLGNRIESTIHAGIENHGECRFFFRADDVGAPGNRFRELLAVFQKYQTPLCLAVVPAWLTAQRWRVLKALGKKTPGLWCWHQHGWRHVNHEPRGKKQEFGAVRENRAIRNDVLRGRRRLEAIMGEDFYPVFTPPWNRCDERTITALKEFGYYGISRNPGAMPLTPASLTDFSIHVDLHTRKGKKAFKEWDTFFFEMKAAVSSGWCGMMIHHQRMNDTAFIFMDRLLKYLRYHPRIHSVHFKDFVG
jgi:hypothetical protein